jgi:hypothetical protein
VEISPHWEISPKSLPENLILDPMSFRVKAVFMEIKGSQWRQGGIFGDKRVFLETKEVSQRESVMPIEFCERI